MSDYKLRLAKEAKVDKGLGDLLLHLKGAIARSYYAIEYNYKVESEVKILQNMVNDLRKDLFKSSHNSIPTAIILRSLNEELDTAEIVLKTAATLGFSE